LSRAKDDPFAALGLPARPDLTDDEVRAAWRRIAAATHPDRADGGDPARFAAAAAAYTVLRTRYGRGEALADLADLARRPGRGEPGRPPPRQVPPKPTARPEREQPGRAPPRPVPPESAAAGRSGATRSGAGLLSRIRRGRVGRLALRVLIAAAVSAGAAAVAGAQPATLALVVGAVTWLLVTARNDLAPPC
jgi:curved DNA-binding protein CbpA